MDQRDEVYVNKAIIRKDFLTGSETGKSLMSQIKTVYPAYKTLPQTSKNMVGSYDAYREPYTNPSISFYTFGSKPSSSLLEEYGVLQAFTNLKDWYGFKFDLTQDNVIFKCGVNTVDFSVPDLPSGETFFSTTHMPDKTMSKWVDAYIINKPGDATIESFCIEKGLDYPITTEIENSSIKNVWCWGIVFNKETLEYGPVKAYVLNYYS